MSVDRSLVTRPPMQRMQMPIGTGYVLVEMPWDLTDEEMGDVIACIEIMRKMNARVRDRRKAEQDLGKEPVNG